MEKKTDNTTVLISKGSLFLVNNIRDTLAKSGYNVIDSAPEVESLQDLRTESDIFIFYLGDFIEETKEAIVFLKDMIIEDEKELYLIGSPEEISAFCRYVPKNYVRKALERPLNVKDLLTALEETEADSDKKKSVLVVDDDGTYLRSVHDWLSGKYQVVMVNSGMNAITYLGTHTPDLVLLDYMMPVCDGPMVLEMMRSDSNLADIPVIFLTGKSDRESVSKVLEMRPAGYLLKSMNPYQLVKAVEHFFEQQKIKPQKKK
ncbi:MAG: response regulator [Lachnospiraceae bacterium]|nr:response regulator [Lachnospiraceae bacterium]